MAEPSPRPISGEGALVAAVPKVKGRSADKDASYIVREMNTLSIADLKAYMHEIGMPEEAWPDLDQHDRRGKFSYTKRKGKARIEVNVKNKHFRINGCADGVTMGDTPVNQVWSAHGGIAATWERAKALSGYCT